MTLLVVGGMTIDDLVLADGTVHRRVPGGNALYCALGARLWDVHSEIVSFVGADYPVRALHRLDEVGIGTAHVARQDTGSVRLWILYEEDGRRQIHLQHDSPSLAPLEPLVSDSIPELLKTGVVDAAHVAALPVRVQRRVARALADADVPFTLDSLEAKGSVGGDLADYLQGPDLAPLVFLPSREEFALLFGDSGSPAFRDWADGTPTAILVVKDGREGSTIFAPPSAPGVHIPAIACDVVDPTGAGDAYCGGFAAGMSLGCSPMESAVMGTVSASFVVEQVGARGLVDAAPDEIKQRRATLELALSRGER